MRRTDASGWLGTALCLIAYLLLSVKQVSDEGPVYWIMNLVGAACLFVNARAQDARPIMWFNVAWMTISIIALARILT